MNPLHSLDRRRAGRRWWCQKFRQPATLVVLGLALLSGCGRNDGANQPNYATALTVAVTKTPEAAAIFVAKELGFFEDVGLDVTIDFRDTGKDAIEPVLGGTADLATLPDVSFVFCALREDPLLLVATLHYSETGTAVIARRSGRISRPEALNGKKIGITPRTKSDYFLDTLLIVNGMSRRDVTIVEMPPEKMVRAVVSGDVDAIVASQPYRHYALQQLGENGIAFDGDGIHRAMFTLVGDDYFVTRNRPAIVLMLRALLASQRYMEKNPEEAQDIVARTLRMAVSDVAAIWDTLELDVSLHQSLLLNLEKQARWAIRSKLSDAREPANFLDFIEISALTAVRPEAVTITK